MIIRTRKRSKVAVREIMLNFNLDRLCHTVIHEHTSIYIQLMVFM